MVEAGGLRKGHKNIIKPFSKQMTMKVAPTKQFIPREFSRGQHERKRHILIGRK